MRRGLVLSFLLSLHTMSLMAERFIVEIEASDVKERSLIASLIHIDSVVDDRVFSVVNRDELQMLSQHKAINLVSVELIDHGAKTSSYYAPFLSVIDFPDADSAFHTYDEALLVMQALEKDHEDLVQVFSIGKSVHDRDIWAMRISDDSEENPNKKGIVYMATHHAREHVSTEMPLMFAKELLDSVVSDADIQALLKQIEIYLIPIVNPDGVVHDITGKRYKWWRKNRRQNSDGSYGVDLNRNYGFGWGTGGSSSTPSSEIYMGTAPFSEPETQVIRDFFVGHPNVTLALSFHTFSELILYPWGGRSEGVGGQDERLFKKMAGDMASMNHYRPIQSSDLYIASGDTCDWLYGELSVYCFTFELSPASIFDGGFYPGASIIERVFEDNLEPMLYLARLADNPQKALE